MKLDHTPPWLPEKHQKEEEKEEGRFGAATEEEEEEKTFDLFSSSSSLSPSVVRCHHPLTRRLAEVERQDVWSD